MERIILFFQEESNSGEAIYANSNQKEKKKMLNKKVPLFVGIGQEKKMKSL
jgi:hypothetical protein